MDADAGVRDVQDARKKKAKRRIDARKKKAKRRIYKPELIRVNLRLAFNEVR